MIKQTNKPTCLFLMGPTASGKTAIALKLAQRLPVEIISVDSALIYRGMDIGTAKPTAEEMTKVPHHLIDIKDPAESYSVAEFRKNSLEIGGQIIQRGKIPLFVGGTMLYYKGLLEGLSSLPSSDPVVRGEIENQASIHGWNFMHQKLQEVDPVSAQRINPNDSQRIERALEVFYLTGKSLTELTQSIDQDLPFNVVQFAVAPENRETLHHRIKQRFYQMLEQGFEQEVERLFQRSDLHLNLPSIRCVGYRQIWEYLEGQYSREEMIYRGICATRQLAKRQITWLRGWKSPVIWLNSQAVNKALDQITNTLEV